MWPICQLTRMIRSSMPCCRLHRRSLCFLRTSSNVRWGKLGMTLSYSCCGLCHPRRVRRVRPLRLPLMLSVVVALRVRNRLLPPLRETLNFSLVVCGATNVRLLFLQLVVVLLNALLSRLPRRRRIFESRSYVPCLLW